MTSIDLATESTAGFVQESLPRTPARILEVGCGEGHLAAHLMKLGHAVVALDPEEAAATAARARGVDARIAAFPDHAGEGRYDAVLFARSLHHIESLSNVYSRVHDLLVPGGHLLVEDWAWRRMDRATAEWTFGLVRLALTAGLIETDEWTFTGDPLATWHAERAAHHRHTADEMLAAARPLFDILEEQHVPFVYRLFCRYLAGREDGRELAERVLAMERGLVEAGAIVPMGLRFVGLKAPSPAGRGEPENQGMRITD